MNSLNTFIQARFTKRIQILSMTLAEGRKLARKAKMKFNETKFSGNAADIILDKIQKKEEYIKLSSNGKKILKTVKLLHMGNIYEPKVDLVKEILPLK